MLEEDKEEEEEAEHENKRILLTEDVSSPRLDTSLLTPRLDTSLLTPGLDTSLLSGAFKKLSLHTDINIAPVNWLRGDHGDMVQESCYWSITDAPEMSAIKMATQQSRELLSADVISDSRNIKKLLKMGRGVEEVSMAVHRIGKTLLIDEFPSSARYMSAPGSHDPATRRKARSTPPEGPPRSTPPEGPPRRKTRSKKKQSTAHVTTLSKFLFHTLLNNSYTAAASSNVVARKNSLSSSDMIVGMGDPLSKLKLEIPQIFEANLPCPPKQYIRTVYWDFEDIHMLLGNNMPIFGGGEYPAISLKLRDMKQPINVLTGIDCWLDNLICNVPELAMCWHLDGFIQGYDLYKTEDIPDLAGCKFDPVVIQDLASNVLRFLKGRCIKEGHTYWLYRAKGDDIVKLYDLSSICSGINLGEMNPFSTPVAMLCFKVAQRLFEEGNPDERSTIYTLLLNCLNLIPSKSYPQMEATAHFIIADLFLSNRFTLTPDNKIVLSVESLHSCQFENLPNVYECSLSRDLLDNTWEPPAPRYYWTNIAKDLKSQKKQSLSHIVSALELVAPINEGWAVKLQKLLLFKSSAIFLHDSEHCEEGVVFTNALLSLITIEAYNALLYHRDIKYSHGYGYDILRCLVLCRVSDVTLAQLLSSCPTTSLTTIDNILITLSTYARNFDVNCTKIFEWCCTLVSDESLSKRLFRNKFETKEVGLLLCLDMYLEASRIQQGMADKKLGFVYNELGSYNLSLITLEDTLEEEVAKKLLKESFDHYKSALAQFEECGDLHNTALILSNLGKVMRISGQLQARFYYGTGERGPLLYEERELYKEAVNYYNRALDKLRKPSSQKDIWCAVSNELSGVYFTMASTLQDYNDQTGQEVVREVTNLYNKALRISENLVKDGFTAAAGRPGGIHHKLASLYHLQTRGLGPTRRRRRLYELADTCYMKAISYFTMEGFEMEYIQAVMEYVGLLQYSSPTPLTSLPKCYHLLHALAAPLQLTRDTQSRYTQSRDTQSRDTQSRDHAKMLALLKEQMLALLRSVLVLVKQGKVLEGIGDVKVIFGAALRNFQGFSELDQDKMFDVVIDVLNLLC